MPQNNWEEKLREYFNAEYSPASQQTSISKTLEGLYQFLVSKFSSLIEQTRKEQREKMRKNIGMLRQWLNERPNKNLVTNDEIEYWLYEEKQL